MTTACSDVCSNSIVDERTDPSGEWKAVMFQRDCGSITGFSTQISIIRSNGQPAGAGNVFRADDDHGTARVGYWGGPWTRMKWTGRNDLLVRYADKSRIFAQKNDFSGVRITYRAVVR